MIANLSIKISDQMKTSPFALPDFMRDEQSDREI